MTGLHFVALPGIAALILNLVLIPVILKLSHTYGWYDGNDHRKIHTEDTPRIGGLGIIVSFLVASLAGLTLFRVPGPMQTTGSLSTIVRELGPVYAGLLIIFGIGIIDDFKNLRAIVKLIGQITAGTVVSFSAFRITGLAVPGIGSISFGILGYPLTVLWIVGLVNALNFIDGMDGLAGSTSLVAAVFLSVIAFSLGNQQVGMLALTLSGSLLGFLVFNTPPAKIFMGDSGSTSIGFLLAVLPLFGSNGIDGEMGLIPTVTLLLIPVIDTAAAILRRLRKGVPVYSPDREHLHHKLLDLGLSTWKILFVVCGGGMLSGLAALIWVQGPPLPGIAAVVIVWIAGTLSFLYLHKIRHAKPSV